MKKYFELVDDGLKTLHTAMVDFIVSTFRKKYGRKWWDEILNALSEQWDLPKFGDDEELADSLDLANCFRIFMRCNFTLYYDKNVSINCKNWASELMGVRNKTAHDGIKDILQPDAERYLDTMVRLAETFNRPCAEEIRNLYFEARKGALDIRTEEDSYYPAANQKSTIAAPNINLLAIDDTAIVEKTGLTRKLTIQGQTRAYPVYRVRLDKLFYNDRNDRILTWISQYKDENGVDNFDGISLEDYNGIIESFVIKSNPTAIERTKNNIATFNQREPGVTLADGRIIDGNRRFTCLRLLNKEDPSVNYFETVILGDDVGRSEKDIKMLELSIQHGEEQKVEYSQIELVIGAYEAIVDKQILSVEEYAACTNESIPDVKKRLDAAALIVEYLKFMKVPGQYHIARDMQAYTIFVEILPILNKCSNDREKENIKRSVFTNTMLEVFPDQRKYARNLKSLYGTVPFKSYIQRETRTADTLSEELEAYGIGGSNDLAEFIKGKTELKKEQSISFEKAMNQSQKAQTKNKPARNVTKCIELLMEIDTGVFSKLSQEERESLKALFVKLGEVSAMISGEITDE